MNGKCPLPGKHPGIPSIVRNNKRPGHVSIFYLFFTSFFRISKIKSSRKSFPSKVSVPYSIASAVCYGARYMECVRIGNVAYTHAHAVYYYCCNIDPTPWADLGGGGYWGCKPPKPFQIQQCIACPTLAL